MFTKFKTNYKTIFLDPNSSNIAVDEKVNVILSPSLYWVKKIKLPVKYISQAKKLLPSIFEDILPEGKYNYFTYKVDDEFFVFAYEDKKILDIMTNKGLSPSNIANVYFAQSELANIKGAVNISEEQSIYVKNDIVVLVPCCWIEEKSKLDLVDLQLSKHKIVLEQYTLLVEKSSLYKIWIILSLFSILLFSQYIISANQVDAIYEKKDNLFAKYHLKSTMFQNKSLLKKYKLVYEKQTKFREIMSYILALKLKSSQKISLFTFKDKKINLNFSGVEQGEDIVIENIFKSKKLKYKSSFKNKIYSVEIIL